MSIIDKLYFTLMVVLLPIVFVGIVYHIIKLFR